jgi:DNA-binding NtrC family response regulator
MFLEDMNAAGDRQLSGFTHEALDQLAAYPWPGNMDELTEFVGYAFRRAAGPLVSAADLPDRVRFAADASSHAPRPQETIVLDEFLSEIETELIHRALQYAKGNRTKAAQLLGITRSRLLRRLEPSGPDFTPIDE